MEITATLAAETTESASSFFDAHMLEFGIVVTNLLLVLVTVKLVSVTWKAIPKSERPHRACARRMVRRYYRQHRLTPIQVTVRHQYLEWETD